MTSRMTWRVPVASVAGLVFLTMWIAGAVVLADAVHRLNPVLQFAYFATAGFVWVFPIRWLMLWAVHMR
jgi:hypothetical protein